MNKNQDGFSHVLILLVLVFAVIGGAGWLVITKQSKSVNDLPKCPDGKNLLKTSIIKEEDLTTIIPLGNLAPPGHVLPTSHMYFNYRQAGDGPDKYTIETAIYSPADITATRMLEIDTTNDRASYKAYRIDFDLCQEVSGYFILVQKLNDALANAYESGQDLGSGGNRQVNVKLKAGELIGYGGGKIGYPSGIDFTIIDKREPKPLVASAARWHESGLYFSCSLDYFEPELSKRLYKKIGNFNLEYLNPGDPVCGTVYQDLPGTVQGVWVTRDVKGQLVDSEYVAALVHSNFNHKKGAFSFGNKIKEIGINNNVALLFEPKNSGLINLDFNLVKDNKVYCYDTDNGQHQSNSKETILLQLVNNETIRVGRSPKPCNQTELKMSKYVEYIR